METNKICKICKTDHGAKNTGPLTACELEQYMLRGATGTDSKGKKYDAFGVGNRFQHPGAK